MNVSLPTVGKGTGLWKVGSELWNKSSVELAASDECLFKREEKGCRMLSGVSELLSGL